MYNLIDYLSLNFLYDIDTRNMFSRQIEKQIIYLSKGIQNIFRYRTLHSQITTDNFKKQKMIIIATINFKFNNNNNNKKLKKFYI